MAGHMSRIYALANQKGGVGKTTTAINLAACLAEAGERALVIDLDPQANATSGLGMRANGTSSYDLLDGAPLEELAKHTKFPNLDLVPSKPELAGAVVELAQRGDGERYLSQALASGTSKYDFVFLDCPPSLGPLTVNALAAADRVLVPVQAEYYALEGLTQLMQSIDLIRRRLNPSLGSGGESRPAGDRLRPPLGWSGCVLEGGDGACRAPLIGAASVAASRFSSAESWPGPPSCSSCRSMRFTRTRSSRA